ncbi:hypothetical protein ABW21_db0206055 [Orbilia brochopaga]|nr:hypothetical protein ABW21_db0206055 [Drechslerella brochopaga]
MIADMSQRQQKLPPGICWALANLLEEDDKNLRFEVRRALRLQREWIDDEGATILRKIFKTKPLDVVLVFGVRLSILIDPPIPWIIKQLKLLLDGGSQNRRKYRYEISELGDLLSDLLRLEPRMDDWDGWRQIEDLTLDSNGKIVLGKALQLKANLTSAVFEKLILKASVEGLEASDDVLRALCGRPETVWRLLDMLEANAPDLQIFGHPRMAEVWETSLAELLPNQLDSILERLGDIVFERDLSSKAYVEAAGIIIAQPQLSVSVIRKMISMGSFSARKVRLRTARELCYSVAALDSFDISRLLWIIYLRQPIEDAVAAWIDGDYLFWYDPHAPQENPALKIDGSFRERFREAQIQIHVPGWQLIGLEDQPQLKARRWGEDVYAGLP